MHISQTDSNIAIVFESGEARSLLSVLDGRQGPTLGFLRQALDNFCNGSDVELIEAIEKLDPTVAPEEKIGT